MDFTLSDAQRAWQEKGRALARDWPIDMVAAAVAESAHAAGVFAADFDAPSAVALIEAAGIEHPVGAVTLALQVATSVSLAGAVQLHPSTGRAVALSSEVKPRLEGDRLNGRATWVGPMATETALIVGAAQGDEIVACAVAASAAGVAEAQIRAAGLHGFACSHLTFTDTPCVPIGSPKPVMARVRVLLAAAGIGMGRRAAREALRAAMAYGRTGAGGEQTAQGLLADAATELDAAMLLVHQAALRMPMSLAQASMAKLAASEAAQRAVARATQIVGAESFREGHILEQLTQDVRALELFAGRTEALREAVADEVLPRG
ncbi:MAG TPA: acyl-CoA dehydrogenase family protein [Vicinamibacterales bacterium]|nr:acyl-CoA dehydrogenase family protein [Vicinamibacterales bacterium]